MKICPACDRTYHDEELNFCLMCGVALADGAVQPTVIIRSESEPTVVIPTASEPTAIISVSRPTIAEQKKHGIWFWIGITVACIVGVTGATFGAFFLYFLFTGDGGKSTNQNRNRKGEVVVKTPANSRPSPTIYPSPDDVTPSPTPQETRTPTGGSTATEIDWETTAVDFADETFEKATFYCPPNGKESTVFGSDIYAVNSSICTAAVHAGKTTFGRGGEVTIIFGPGLEYYVTTTRNDVTTNMFGDKDTSFVFE